MTYPHLTIDLNNREIRLADVLTGNIAYQDLFEQATCTFIRDWLAGVDNFSLQTSGSTGPPKNISVTRGQMIANATGTIQKLGLHSAKHSLVCLDTSLIAGKMMVVRSFLSGMYIHAISPSANPLERLRWDGLIDLAALVPYQLEAILHSRHSKRLDLVAFILLGGAPVSLALRRNLQRYGCTFLATYGMTETISHIALQFLNGRQSTDFFETLPDITIETDNRSCLVIHAPYIGFPVITNDIVQLQGKTTFRWIGRADFVINSGGIKISPESVESALAPVLAPYFDGRFLISSIPDPLLSEKIVLILESQEQTEAYTAEIMRIVKVLTNRYEIPKEVLTLASFPLTASGKINRLEVKRMVSKQL